MGSSPSGPVEMSIGLDVQGGNQRTSRLGCQESLKMERTLVVGPSPTPPGRVQSGPASFGILRTTPLCLGPEAPFFQLSDSVGLGTLDQFVLSLGVDLDGLRHQFGPLGGELPLT
jgi:hypothetical protein